MISLQDNAWIDEAVEKIVKKMDLVSERSRNKIPYTAKNGVHDDRSREDQTFSADDGLNWWCNGFWAGMLWQMYHVAGDEKYAKIARISEEKLDRCFSDYYGLHHDVGFMFLPSAVADYRLTGNPDSRKRGLHAANLLAGRFNPVGKFIRAWNDIPGSQDDTIGWSIIDFLFNIPLLYWASEETKDPRFGQIAKMHADTVMETFVRPDGSVRHIVEFDPFTGEMVRDYGGQGYGQGSSWTRGQTWGLYGFLMSYRHTGKQEYLDTAKRIAHYFIANAAMTDYLPLCDFRAPEEPVYYDSTAGACAACGLLEIARFVPENEKKLYEDSAYRILRAMEEHFANWDEDADAILEMGKVAYHGEAGQEAIIYGDYFFIEAILRMLDKDCFIW